MSFYGGMPGIAVISMKKDPYTGKWLAGWSHDPSRFDDKEEIFEDYYKGLAWLLKELNWIGCDSGGELADQALQAGNQIANRTDFVPSSYAFKIGDATYFIIREVERTPSLDNHEE